MTVPRRRRRQRSTRKPCSGNDGSAQEKLTPRVTTAGFARRASRGLLDDARRARCAGEEVFLAKAPRGELARRARAEAHGEADRLVHARTVSGDVRRCGAGIASRGSPVLGAAARDRRADLPARRAPEHAGTHAASAHAWLPSGHLVAARACAPARALAAGHLHRGALPRGAPVEGAARCA